LWSEAIAILIVQKVRTGKVKSGLDPSPKQLKQEGKVEFRDAPKTGGYFPFNLP